MAERAEKQDRREFIIAQLEHLMKSGYTEESMARCLKTIRPPVMELQQGQALYTQLEKLVRAQNADRAIKLMEVVPTRTKKQTFVLMAVGVILALVVGILVFFLNASN